MTRSSAAYMREYMRGYRVGERRLGQPVRGQLCIDCGEPCRSKSGRCRPCLTEWEVDRVELVPGACRECGLRNVDGLEPLPIHERAPGRWICDACEWWALRMREEDDGVPGRLRSHSTAVPA